MESLTSDFGDLLAANSLKQDAGSAGSNAASLAENLQKAMQPVFEQLTEVGDEVVLQTGDGKQFKVIRCDGEEVDSEDEAEENAPEQEDTRKEPETDAGLEEEKQQDTGDFEYYDEEEAGESEGDPPGQGDPQAPPEPIEESAGQSTARFQ